MRTKCKRNVNKLEEYQRSVASNKFNFLIYSAVFFTCHVLRNVVRVLEGEII